MTTTSGPARRSTRRPPLGLVRDAALAGVVAAAVTTTMAAVATAADVSLEVEAKSIPLSAFAFWTLVATLVGTVLTVVVRTRRRFVVVAAAATGLSLVPTLVLPDDLATTIVLILTHVVAAAIIVPAIARHLPRS